MKKLLVTSLFYLLLIFTICACEKNVENNEKEHESTYADIDLGILFKEYKIYQSDEKSWNDFEWLRLIPEYPESKKLDYIEYQEGDFINLYYKNANYEIVRKWADSLLDIGFYENKYDEKYDDYIAIKRRSLELELRANPYFYYADNRLWIFVSRTEYQRELQDALFYLEQNNISLEEAEEIYKNNNKKNS